MLMLLAFFPFVIAAFDSLAPVYRVCNTGKFSDDSSASQDFSTVLEALTDLSSSTSFNTANHNQFYGMYQCRGDISVNAADCSTCVAGAEALAKKNCPNAIGLRLQLDGCYLRYEKYSFSTADYSRVVTLCNTNKNKDSAFQQNVDSLLKSVIAAAPANGGYASGTAQGLFAVAQCLGFLTAKECASCLANNANGKQACNQAVGVQVHAVDCYYRFETFPFFNQ